MKNILLTIFLCAAGFVQSGLACSLITTPIGKFDEGEFIFIGKVTGYTASVKLRAAKPGRSFETHGLIVDVKESVYLPERSGSKFEVFPIDLWADCSRGGFTLKDLQKGFPVGIEIRVIARKAKVVPQVENGPVIRLEDYPGTLSITSPNTDEAGRSVTSSASVYDYSSYDLSKDRESPVRSDLPSFEARKDLLRLKNAVSQKERDSILERLMSIAYIDDLEFVTMLKLYAANETEADRYYEKNLEKFSPEAFTQYIVLKNTRAELAKRGYKSEDIKKAIDGAMRDGVDFTVDAVVKGSLKYLPPAGKR